MKAEASEGGATKAENVRGRRPGTPSLAAMGVVYGDIGTGPPYAIRDCFHGEYGIAPTPENILGVLSSSPDFSRTSSAPP